MKRLLHSASVPLLLFTLFIKVQSALAQSKLDLDWFFEELENNLPCNYDPANCARYKNPDWNTLKPDFYYRKHPEGLRSAGAEFKDEQSLNTFLNGLDNYNGKYQVEKIHDGETKTVHVIKKDDEITGFVVLRRSGLFWFKAFRPFTNEQIDQEISKLVNWSADNFESLKGKPMDQSEAGVSINQTKNFKSIQGMINASIATRGYSDRKSAMIFGEMPVYDPDALRFQFKNHQPEILGLTFEKVEENEGTLTYQYTQNNDIYRLSLTTKNGEGQRSVLSFEKQYDIKTRERRPAESSIAQPKTVSEPSTKYRTFQFESGKGAYGVMYKGQSISEARKGRSLGSWKSLLGELSKDGKAVYLAHGEGEFYYYAQGVSFGVKQTLSKVYVGEFSMGQMHGKGSLSTTDQDGETKETITGTWKNGQLHGDDIRIEDHEKRTIATGTMNMGKRTGSWAVENKRTGTTTTINY